MFVPIYLMLKIFTVSAMFFDYEIAEPRRICKVPLDNVKNYQLLKRRLHKNGFVLTLMNESKTFYVIPSKNQQKYVSIENTTLFCNESVDVTDENHTGKADVFKRLLEIDRAADHCSCNVIHPGFERFPGISNGEEMDLLKSYATLHLCLFTLSFFANVLVIISIVKRKNTTYFDSIKLTLAVIDLITVTSILTVSSLETFQEKRSIEVVTLISNFGYHSNYSDGKENLCWNHTNLFCVPEGSRGILLFINNYIFSVSIPISFSNISLMAFLDLFSAALPMRHRLLTRQKVFLAVIFSWLVPAILVISTNYNLRRDRHTSPASGTTVFRINLITRIVLLFATTVLSYVLILIIYIPHHKNKNIYDLAPNYIPHLKRVLLTKVPPVQQIVSLAPWNL